MATDQELISLRFFAMGANGTASREQQIVASRSLFCELLKRNLLEMPDELGDGDARPAFVMGTIYERIVAFMKHHDNRPASVTEIRKALGANRGSVAMVLHSTHRDKFEKCPPDEMQTHLPRWRLK